MNNIQSKRRLKACSNIQEVYKTAKEIINEQESSFAHQAKRLFDQKLISESTYKGFMQGLESLEVV